MTCTQRADHGFQRPSGIGRNDDCSSQQFPLHRGLASAGKSVAAEEGNLCVSEGFQRAPCAECHGVVLRGDEADIELAVRAELHPRSNRIVGTLFAPHALDHPHIHVRLFGLPWVRLISEQV